MRSLRPRLPPGCERAKSSSRKPRASSRATASASPSAICAVVLAVGARLSGHASWSTALETTMSAWRARLLSAPPVIATSVTPRRLIAGRMAPISSLSPRVGDRQHDVVLGHHAEVAVAGLGRMDEERRRAGRGERRRDLAADVAALAHAHDDDPAAAGEHRLHRGDEAFALARLQARAARAPRCRSVLRASASTRLCIEGGRGWHGGGREGVQ